MRMELSTDRLRVQCFTRAMPYNYAVHLLDTHRHSLEDQNEGLSK